MSLRVKSCAAIAGSWPHHVNAFANNCYLEKDNNGRVMEPSARVSKVFANARCARCADLRPASERPMTAAAADVKG